MKPDEFVQAIKISCRDGAVSDCVKAFDNPPGRKPDPELLRISHWFRALSPTDRQFVEQAMRESADATLFGVLCIIDGVRFIEPEGEKSEFHLSATLNGVVSQISPNESYLHDILRSEP